MTSYCVHVDLSFIQHEVTVKHRHVDIIMYYLRASAVPSGIALCLKRLMDLALYLHSA